MKQVLCVGGCRAWFDSREHWCPECGWERPRSNSWLATAKWNSNLFSQAAHADNERKIGHAIRQGYDMSHTDKRVLKTARQVVKDL